MSAFDDPQRHGKQEAPAARLEGDSPGGPLGRRALRAGGVVGERGIAAVARTLSLQARISNWLAMGVMLLVGSVLLVWYYAHQAGRSARSHQAAAPARQWIAAEMTLPPLGPIEPPAARPAASAPGPGLAAAAVAGSGDDLMHLPAVPSAVRVPGASVAPVLTAVPPDGFGDRLAPLAPAVRPAAHGATRADRRLSAEVYVAAAPGSSPRTPPAVAPGPAAAAAVAAAPAPVELVQAADGTTAKTGLDAAVSGAGPDTQLSAPMAVPVTARLLRRQGLILPKGTSIDCTLETAIDSTLPGLTRCLTATDTFGADGHVVLLERGTELVGETQSQVQQGAARVFVLWNEARTPQGVIVPLESPGADELGRAGLPGRVQRHFWERFGAAILVSTIDGAVQAAVQSSSRDNGTVIYNPGASQDVMTEVLRSTVAIPPTVRKANGDRIEVLVARDVDFGDVYELRASDTRR